MDLLILEAEINHVVVNNWKYNVIKEKGSVYFSYIVI